MLISNQPSNWSCAPLGLVTSALSFSSLLRFLRPYSPLAPYALLEPLPSALRILLFIRQLNV
jgi:hypothetical protein